MKYNLQVIFSSLWEIAVPFTRDYDLIKSAADSITLYDKTCLDEAFTAAVECVQATWGSAMSTQVIVIYSSRLTLFHFLLGTLDCRFILSTLLYDVHNFVFTIIGVDIFCLSLIQVVLITDGLMDISDDVYEKITTMVVPFPCDFHLHCVSAADEFCCDKNITRLKVTLLVY